MMQPAAAAARGCLRRLHRHRHRIGCQQRRQQSSSSGSSSEKSGFKWKWVPIPVGVGVATMAVLQYRHSMRRERQHATGETQHPAGETPVVLSESAVSFLTSLPTRSLSRAWGWINEKTLPRFLRRPILGLYANAFGCNMQEAVVEDLTAYTSLQELFTRKLKPSTRPVSNEGLMVSPADARLMHFRRVDPDGETVEQVKGVTYSARTLVGGPLPAAKPGNHVYQCILYLAPGDYHHFHAPDEFHASTLRHFDGHLLSVSLLAMRNVRGLLAINERAALLGTWKHGFMAYVAVGAYNVASITIDGKPDLYTNRPLKDGRAVGDCSEYTLLPNVIEGEGCPNRVNPYHECTVPYCEERYGKPGPLTLKPGRSFARGEHLGAFRLGSTVVLLFEGPEDLVCTVQHGEFIRVGEPLIVQR
eukprot:m.288879 g.288879  ORF g.288879 m.288879 type:complete len:417 (+) comp19455_c0_seq4:338-1588(+)